MSGEPAGGTTDDDGDREAEDELTEAPDDQETAERETADQQVGDETADQQVEDVERIHGAAVTRIGGQLVLHPGREDYLELAETLRTDGYWLCVDLCGVDYLIYEADRGLPPGIRAERFEVVVGLVDPTRRRRLRLRVQVPGDDPTLASLVSVHPGADGYERETWDLFGIRFEGHPGLSRILLPDEWVGHPLRKDSPAGDIPVQFKAPRELRR